MKVKLCWRCGHRKTLHRWDGRKACRVPACPCQHFVFLGYGSATEQFYNRK